ncbi:unnamed protein product [Pichia kudriavzevii]
MVDGNKGDMLSYTIDGQVFNIHIDNPEALNSFTIPQFIELAELFIKAQEADTSITLLTAKGKFFSTGANIKYVSQIVNKSRLEYYEAITSKNILLVHTILNHSKLIVVALNGPVIGLTAALVCLMDVIYAKRGDVYMQYPFSSIGLVNECGVSASLPYRIGLTRSLEAVSLARRIELDELIASGFVTKTYDADSVELFNQQVKRDLLKMTENLAQDSISANKEMIKNQFHNQVMKQITDESMSGLQRWVDERPQSAFARMATRVKRGNGKL